MLKGLLSKTIELTVRKKNLVEEILHLTSKQAGLLETEEVQKLLALIYQKQKCIEDIDAIDSELRQMEAKILNMSRVSAGVEGNTVFYKDWKSNIEALRRDMQAPFKEAQRLDELNRKNIAKEFNRLKKSMQSLSARKGSLKAYQGNALQPGGYFIDHKK